MINLFIGGKFQKPSSGKYQNEIAIADDKDLNMAIDISRKVNISSESDRRKFMLEFVDLLEKQKTDFINEMKSLSDAENDFLHSLQSLYYFIGVIDKWKDLYISGAEYKVYSIKSPVIYQLNGNVNFTGLISSILRPLSYGASSIIIVPIKWAKIANMLSLIFLNLDIPAGTINFLTGFKSENKNILKINFESIEQSVPAHSTEIQNMSDIIISKKINL